MPKSGKITSPKQVSAKTLHKVASEKEQFALVVQMMYSAEQESIKLKATLVWCTTPRLRI